MISNGKRFHKVETATLKHTVALCPEPKHRNPPITSD